MARTVRHHRLPPDELLERLRELDMTPWVFAAFFEVRRETMARWLLPIDDPNALAPPWWVTVALELLLCHGAPNRVRMLHEANRISDDEQDA